MEGHGKIGNKEKTVHSVDDPQKKQTCHTSIHQHMNNFVYWGQQ